MYNSTQPYATKNKLGGARRKIIKKRRKKNQTKTNKKHRTSSSPSSLASTSGASSTGAGVSSATGSGSGALPFIPLATMLAAVGGVTCSVQRRRTRDCGITSRAGVSQLVGGRRRRCNSQPLQGGQRTGYASWWLLRLTPPRNRSGTYTYVATATKPNQTTRAYTPSDCPTIQQ